MSSRIEILNAGGYRSDGRRQYELRTIAIDFSPQGSNPDGSATISHGLTQVSVSVYGPREAKMRSQTFHDRANINIELSIAPFSAGERRRRGKGDKRILELTQTLKSTFEPVIQTSLYPRAQIDIYVQVLQQDGGLLQACINATTLALVNAGIPMLDLVCAVTGGVHSTSALLDLTQLEENDLPNVTIAVMPRSGKIALVSMETRLHVDRFEEIFRLAGEAGTVIHSEMKRAVKEKTAKLVDAMQLGKGSAAPNAENDY
ncbi:Exosome non-catalytic core component [Marasmius tenuissimus]|uniref:Exosome non-catalytic core component n=1 Tax=Marasmius tenuissimus TaxID=585030 RepID=A0ABR2ZJ82_9AGAR|nr:Exosome non-catalytic core component [Marasmius tenuissimus]